MSNNAIPRAEVMLTEKEASEEVVVLMAVINLRRDTNGGKGVAPLERVINKVRLSANGAGMLLQ